MARIGAHISRVRERLLATKVPQSRIAHESGVAERTLNGFFARNQTVSVRTIERLEAFLDRHEADLRDEGIAA